MFIYKITNIINGKFYIGCTKFDIGTRFVQHKCVARNGSEGILHKAMRKYGASNFICELLDKCNSIDEMLAAEIKYIAEMSPAYNISKGGRGNLGNKLTAKHKEKLRKAALISNLTRVVSVETKTKIRNKLLGRKLSAEHIEKVRQGLLRVGCTVKKRMAIDKAIKSQQRAVICLNNDTIYASATIAGRELGIDNSIVSKICKGSCGYKTGKGYSFVFAAPRQGELTWDG